MGDLYKLLGSILTSEQDDEPVNVVDGLFAIARAVNNLARSVERLGLNNETISGLGAIEALSKSVLDCGERIASSIGGIADSIEHSEVVK